VLVLGRWYKHFLRTLATGWRATTVVSGSRRMQPCPGVVTDGDSVPACRLVMATRGAYPHHTRPRSGAPTIGCAAEPVTQLARARVAAGSPQARWRGPHGAGPEKAGRAGPHSAWPRGRDRQPSLDSWNGPAGGSLMRSWGAVRSCAWPGMLQAPCTHLGCLTLHCPQSGHRASPPPPPLRAQDLGRRGSRAHGLLTYLCFRR